MAIQSSGPIRFSDLAAEFGDTAPHSFSEFYREGGKVPGVNSAVAASGAIRLGTFYNAVNELLQAVTANASINAQTIFGSDWGSAVPKRLSIPSGVVIGPLTIPAGLGGTLEVDVAGEVQGLGGSANSGAGGNAITANSSFTLNVLSGGAVRGGGGGGGAGGTGGGGSYSQNVTQGPYGPSWGSYIYIREENSEGDFRGYTIYWAGSQITSGNTGIGTSANFGGWTYSAVGGSWPSALRRSRNTTTNTNGGSGGSGGVGRGYGQVLTSGAGGSGGGTNAGTGGTGGTGGDWGTGGNTGNTGANGNRTGGAAGSGGGAAGRAVLMSAGTLTLNNSGTINGAY